MSFASFRIETAYLAADRLSREVWIVRAEAMSYSDPALTMTLLEVRWDERPTPRHKFGQVRRWLYRSWEEHPNGFRQRGVPRSAWVDASRAPGADVRSCHDVIPPPSPPADLIGRIMATLRPKAITIPANPATP